MLVEEVSLNPIKCPMKMREGRKRGETKIDKEQMQGVGQFQTW